MSQGADAQRYSEYREKLVKEQSKWVDFKESPRWLSLVADLLGIASVVAIPFLAQHGDATVTVALLIVVAGVAMLTSLILHRRNQRVARYARAMSSLHLAIHILRDEAAVVTQWSDAQVKNCLAEVLSAFTNAFSIIVGAPCRACIKVIDFIPPEGKPRDQITHEEALKYCFARTFCRDTATLRMIGKFIEDPMDAPVKLNTDFRFLDDVRQRYFLGNNLPEAMKSGKYENTSIHKYGGGQRDSGWTLPYKATMVWPIRVITKVASGKGQLHFTGHQDIVGYLAVDTLLVNAFHEEIDCEVGALLADALYLFFTSVYFQHEEKARDGQQRAVQNAAAVRAPVA